MRRKTRITLLVLLIAASAFGAILVPRVFTNKRPPNVLFITVDDLNTYIGCLKGHPQTLTPNIDQLADRGVLFTNAHASAPLCNPSRISFFTGLMPSTTGIYGNLQPLRAALPDALTLMEFLRSKGYVIAGSGKLFHGSKEDPQSWDEYFVPQLEPLPEKRPLNGMSFPAPFDWGPVDTPEDEMPDVQTVHWAMNFLKQEHDKPFFLGVGLARPHLPMYAPEKYFEPFQNQDIALPSTLENDLNDIPPAGQKLAEAERWNKPIVEHNKQKYAVAAYLACVHFADAQVGRVLDVLKSSPYAENTIVIFLGDNGWHLGEKEHWHKGTLWREATQVPLIVQAPNVTSPSAKCAEPVSLLDLYPTVLELCGIAPPENLEGISLLTQLENPETQRDKPVLCTAGLNNHAVISKEWRYIHYADNSEELYHLPDDPHEWKNLAMLPEYAEIKTELRTSLPTTNAPESPSVIKTWKPR